MVSASSRVECLNGRSSLRVPWISSVGMRNEANSTGFGKVSDMSQCRSIIGAPATISAQLRELRRIRSSAFSGRPCTFPKPQTTASS